MGWLIRKYAQEASKNKQLAELCHCQGQKIVSLSQELATLRKRYDEQRTFLRMVGHDMFHTDFPIPRELIEDD